MIQNNKTTQNFTTAYEKLNPEQKLAVDTIEGPVLVNAGPGTGKTQILATRIGNILLQTDINPENILCLTYTDNGAVEMRNRLLKIIGNPAYKVQIHTFHSFCNEIIQDNLAYFGALNLEPIGDLEEIELFYELIDKIPNDNVLKRLRGEIYYEKNRLKNLFSLMKKEAWEPAYIIEQTNTYIDSLPTKEGYYYKTKYKDKKAGDLKQGAIDEETKRMEMLKAAVSFYELYNNLMVKKNRYTYDDMILWVLKAFEENKSLLLDYQERFLYILVDEFQDTSRSQNLLLQQLNSYWDVPNVFAVGDADQSIFSFQDANVKNIEHFKNKFINDIVEIDLTKNYRSTQIILNAAHHLITKNNLRITNNDKPLISSLEALKEISTAPKVIEFPNPSHEAVYITQQIEKLLEQGVKGNEIAVIYRNHKQADEIITMLEQKKIAINTKRKINILTLPFIENIISILTWIDAEKYIPYSGDDILFKMLHSKFFENDAIEIAKQAVAVKQENNKTKGDKFSLRSWLNKLPNEQGNLFSESKNNLKKTILVLENLLYESSNCTLQQLFEKLIQNTGVLAYILSNEEKPWLMQVLTSLFNFIKEETKKNPDITLRELLKIIELMQKNYLSIDLNKIIANENGINFTTAHSSKGSEFECVFILGCTENSWDKLGGRNTNFKLPDNLISNYSNASDLEEARRLFYVATTRAKKFLQISYAVKDDNDKNVIASSFVEEICENKNIPIETITVNDAVLVNYSLLQYAQKVKPEIKLVEETYINQLLQHYTLSVTHLNNYLSCPLKFYYQNLIQVPAAKSESMAFGSAVHYALDTFFKTMLDNNYVFPTDVFLMDSFKWHMNKNREAFTPETYALRLAYGEKILPKYYEHYIHVWHKKVTLETSLRNIMLDDIPLNGKLDKIEFFGNDINVVDYKTGKFDNAKKKLNPPDESEPNGGDYWRQAVFYKILIDNDKTRQWNVVSTAFEFVEPKNDEYKTVTIPIQPQDTTTVIQQIKDTWKKIQAKDFKTGCGKPECEWCNFVKTNKLYVALHQLEDEE